MFKDFAFDLRFLGWAAFQWEWLPKCQSTRKPGANSLIQPGSWHGENVARSTARIRQEQLQRKLSVQQVGGGGQKGEEQFMFFLCLLSNMKKSWAEFPLCVFFSFSFLFFFTTAHAEHRPRFFCGKAQRGIAHRYIKPFSQQKFGHVIAGKGKYS